MIFLYLFVGFIAACIAAAPPGAANVVIINTSLKDDMRKVLYIALGAGVGEVILSLIALHCTMNFIQFFQKNPWLQISVIILFFIAGTYFMLRKWIAHPASKKTVVKKTTPKAVTGFLLAFLNPPVLIFWVVSFTLMHEHIFQLSTMSSFLALFLFFSGVYLGKVATLYAYGKWGEKLASQDTTVSSKKDYFIGAGLLLVGLIQGIRFFIT